MSTDKLPDDDDLGARPQDDEPEEAEFALEDAPKPFDAGGGQDDLFVLELEGDVKDDVLVDDVRSRIEITGQGPSWRQVDAGGETQPTDATGGQAEAEDPAESFGGLDVQELVTFSESGETAFGGTDDEIDFVADMDQQAPSQIVDDDLFEGIAEESEQIATSTQDERGAVRSYDGDDLQLTGSEAFLIDDGSLGSVAQEREDFRQEMSAADETDAQVDADHGGWDQPPSHPEDAVDWQAPSNEVSEEVEETLARALRSQDAASVSPTEDPIYGQAPSEALATHPVFQEPDAGEPNYDRLEPILRDAEPQRERVFVVAPRRSHVLRVVMAASMAACLLVIGLVTFVTLRPDVPFSQTVRGWIRPATVAVPAIEVAMVTRPKVPTDYELPMVAGAPTPTPTSGTGPVAAGEIDPATRRKYEQLVAGLSAAGGIAAGLAKDTLRRRLELAAHDRASRPAEVKSPLPSGTGTAPVASPGQPPAAGDPNAVAAAPARRVRKSLAQMNPDIARGSQAFVQLGNGNFFVGRVQKMQDEELTLVVENDRSEISFFADDMQQLLPVADAEARVLQAGPDGYVRLKNKNKIWGKILDSLPDVVTVQTAEARIVIPKESILEISRKQEAEVRLGREEEDWTDESKLPVVEPQVLPKLEARMDPNELPTGTIRVDLGPSPGQQPNPIPDRLRAKLPAVPQVK